MVKVYSFWERDSEFNSSSQESNQRITVFLGFTVCYMCSE